MLLSMRDAVQANKAMIATSQTLASEVGLGILRGGGNAADAAVATAAALNVTEPCSTGIGGDMFALYYDAQTRAVSALNGSGRAPEAVTLERIGAGGWSERHALTVTVPGACQGWADLAARHGTLPLSTLLEPAIGLAEEGFPVAPVTARAWARSAAWLSPEQRMPDGAGGALTTEDLAAHASTWDTPIHTEFRGVRVWECPPNGQGLAALLALNILSGFDLSSLEPLGSTRWHLMIEAMRLAFADARRYVADPEHAGIPLDELLDPGYAEARRGLIDLRRATLDVRHGAPTERGGTVYFCVVDEAGNACSFINSNYMGFGTGLTPAGWGFTLQNRA